MEILFQVQFTPDRALPEPRDSTLGETAQAIYRLSTLVYGVFDIRLSVAPEAAEEIAAAGGKALAIACDMTDYDLVTAGVSKFETEAGAGTDF
jgi:NAD(P)-dependent dehydrogenase (short-subunit alcohol dehydrogenase family)